MKKRKMLKITTYVLSALVVVILLISAYLLVYSNLSRYNHQLKVVQNDLLVNFQTKVDETLSSGIEYISSWMMEDEIIQFATEEKVSSYNLFQLSNRYQKHYYPFQDKDCLYGIFLPGKDYFITNKGILHTKHLEMDYDFPPGSFAFFDSLKEKKFVNNCYLATDVSTTGKRINLFIKRNLQMNTKKEVYGFVSLNLEQVASKLTQLEDQVFLAYQEDKILFNSQPELKNLSIQTVHSEALHDLYYGVGTVKQGFGFLWVLYVFLFLVFIIMGLYGSFYLARFLHRPLENILMQISSDDEADIYDEEAYISSRFVEIKNVNHQLAERVNAQEEDLKQNFVRDLLFGMVTDEVMQSNSEKYGLDHLYGQVVLAILEENGNEVQGTMNAKQIVALLEAKVENSIVMFLNSGQAAVISAEFPYEAFKRAITQAVLQIDEWYGVSYTGAISDGNLSSPRELSRLFNDAMRYLECGDFSYDKLIITKEDLREREEYGYYYPLEFEKNIISCVTNNDFEKAIQMVRMIIEKNLVEMKLSKAALTELKFALVGTVKRILQALKKTEAELFGEGSILYLELSACRTPEEISEKIIEMFSALRDFTEDTYDHANRTLISQLEDYVQNNYDREELSLLLMAEHFNLTVSYISRIFKKYCQENFKDYLANYRIQKATEILDESPYIKISELAKRVGYSNVSSFIRNFKKVKFVSPGEYKKQP